MSSSNHDSLSDRGRSLEEEFFKREDAKLLERLRALKHAETTRDLISRATGIKNKERLDKLMELKIGGETAAALSVLPIVEVAWADGSIDAKEREFLLQHAATKGFVDGYPVSVLGRYEKELLSFVESQHPKALDLVRTKKKLDKDVEDALQAALKAFAQTFVVDKKS